MQVSELCRDSVTVVRRDSPVLEAAQLMRRYHIGTVVVIDVVSGAQVPVGILTDRDIVVGVVAMDLNPRDLTAGDIMTESLVIVPENCDVFDAIAMMRKGGVRRMPVVDAEGGLTGIVSLDDLLPVVAQELADLARLPLVGRNREFAYRH
jgi:CBS domain-containing protein